MTIRSLSSALGLPENQVRSIARAASHSYKRYEIPKKTGGTRTIYHPAKPLKALQRWLAQEVIAKWPVHPAATAYRAGKSVLHNALVHQNSNYLLRMDFSAFFASINEQDLAIYLKRHPEALPDWSDDDYQTFNSLVFRFGALTVGAPSSPGIANAICFDLDSQLSAMAASHQVRYTRYADDLFFSAIQPDILGQVEQKVLEIVSELSLPASLSLNPSKTRHSSKRGARRVTGIVLGSDGGIHIGRRLKRRIRAMIHTYAQLSKQERARLGGLIAYAVGLDPDFKNSLIEKYGLQLVRQASSRS